MTLARNNVQTTGLKHLLVTLLPLILDLSYLLLARVLQTCHLSFPAAAKNNIGAATRHVGCDSYRAWPTGLGDNLGFFLVVLGVQYLVRDLLPSQ